MRSAKSVAMLAVFLGVALAVNYGVFRKHQAEVVSTVKSKVTPPSEVKTSTDVMPATNRVFAPFKSFPKPGDSGAIEIEHGLQPLPFGKMRPEYIRKAERKGAPGKLTIRVVDVDGRPVSGADVYANFFTYEKDEQESVKTTDSEGKAEVEGICCGDMWFSVNNPGYYETRLKYWFYKSGYDCVKDGRWIPWNPVLEVVLKEKRNPVEMNIKYIDIAIPQVGVPFGCDLIAGELIEPYGKGKAADLVFQYDWIPKTNSTNSVWSHHLTILVTNGVDGIVRTKLDTFSQMRFPYAAPDDGYAREAVSLLAGVGDKTLTDKRITETEGLIIRIRSRFDNKGKCVAALYGKISGPVFVNGPKKKIQFECYLNQKENERSLEATGLYP